MEQQCGTRSYLCRDFFFLIRMIANSICYRFEWTAYCLFSNFVCVTLCVCERQSSIFHSKKLICKLNDLSLNERMSWHIDWNFENYTQVYTGIQQKDYPSLWERLNFIQNLNQKRKSSSYKNKCDIFSILCLFLWKFL